MKSPQAKKLRTTLRPSFSPVPTYCSPVKDKFENFQDKKALHGLFSEQRASESTWSIRALFMQPTADGCKHSDEACHLEDAGPLTQIAADGNQSLAQEFCPHCGTYLSDEGDTVAERQQHVDSCKDRETTSSIERERVGNEAAETTLVTHPCDVELSDGSDAFSEDVNVSTAQQLDSGRGSVLAEITQVDAAETHHPQSLLQHASIIDWLETRGLEKYSDCFLRAGANLALLPLLTDQDLRHMGIATLGARKKVLLGAAQLAPAAGAGPGGSVTACGFSGDMQSDWRPGARQEGWVSDRRGAARPSPASLLGLAAGCEMQGGRVGLEGAGGEAEGPRAGNSKRDSSGRQPGCGGVGDWRALSGAGGAALFCANIRQYFQPDPSKTKTPDQPQPASGILQYFQPAGGTVKAKAAAPLSGLHRGGRTERGAGRGCPVSGLGGWGAGRGKGGGTSWAHKATVDGEAPTGAGRRFGGRGRAPAAPIPLKPWHLVPGTSFVVDRFNNLPPGLPNRHWFLTHFHADHYKGLNSRFDSGTLHCSPSTAKLAQQQLRVPSSRIVPHPLNSPFVVDDVRVTFLDANHCPGAVMVLFEPPGEGLRPVLHTGDCRLVPAMQREAALEAVRGRCDLILDTTYCSPEYAFPSQAEVLQFSIDAVKAEAFNPKTLFLFGSYTIGKERLFLEAARVLQRKVYVSATKRKVLDCLDLPPEYSGLLTTNDAETNLHAVPLWMVTHKHMTKILKYYRSRFTNVVGFQPTGWTHERDVNKTRARGRRRQKGTVIIYQVPYSEHSSFTELRDFVQWLNPVRIIPHVNTDNGGPKATRMVKLLRGDIQA